MYLAPSNIKVTKACFDAATVIVVAVPINEPVPKVNVLVPVEFGVTNKLILSLKYDLFKLAVNVGLIDVLAIVIKD
jgi:hypothetical protein